VITNFYIEQHVSDIQIFLFINKNDLFISLRNNISLH
jgi:hypothetical protein